MGFGWHLPRSASRARRAGLGVGRLGLIADTLSKFCTPPPPSYSNALPKCEEGAAERQYRHWLAEPSAASGWQMSKKMSCLPSFLREVICPRTRIRSPGCSPDRTSSATHAATAGGGAADMAAAPDDGSGDGVVANARDGAEAKFLNSVRNKVDFYNHPKVDLDRRSVAVFGWDTIKIG